MYGLGSNDAGGALVSLIGAFLHFYHNPNLPFNIVFAASAEEEISGSGGIELLNNSIGAIDCAIVGETTSLKTAIAERGLMVVDAFARGKAGHAARNEGVNAIYIALRDIEWIRQFKFDKESDWLGPVSVNVTIINAGVAHNQVPEQCTFTLDIRLNEHYSHEQVLSLLQQGMQSELSLRSARLRPSFIEISHPLVLVSKELGLDLYGSPTTSDQALMTWSSIKLGPGDSTCSHSADEYIYIHEIEEGFALYCKLIDKLASYY